MNARDYFSRIPDGSRNAIKRPSNRTIDRSFRNMIERANQNGDCIINVGGGVFRPIPGCLEDEMAFKEYMAKELHRARAIQFKRLVMIKTFESWRRAAEFGEIMNKQEETGERKDA